MQRAAQDKRQTAAALRTAERVAAAVAAAAPAAPTQLGVPGTPLPSTDRLRVLCAALRRAATTARPRARAPPAAATLVVSEGAYREATGAGMTQRAAAAAAAAWAATGPDVSRESLTSECSLKVASWGALVVAATVRIARIYTDAYQLVYGAAVTWGRRKARLHALC